jgi:hypothetical protein
MVLTKVRFRLDTVSVDRLDPKEGYVPGNVVLTTKSANFARTGHSAEEFAFFLLKLAGSLKNAPFMKGVV